MCIALTFTENDCFLLGALRNNQLVSWDIQNGTELCAQRLPELYITILRIMCPINRLVQGDPTVLEICTLQISAMCIALTFTENDCFLLGALRNNQLVSWEFHTDTDSIPVEAR
jgi:hypothetical protein